MKDIPRIIHQVWESENDIIPDYFKLFSQTWKEFNPDWIYRLWSKKTIENFFKNFYPDFFDFYSGYRYDVQRWDAIRYFILYHFGGLYADMDYECLESVDNLLENKQCCFGMEPESHSKVFSLDFVIGNSFMATVPNHPFFKTVIDYLPVATSNARDKMRYVLETTGPHMLTHVYGNYSAKEDIYLIPQELIAPLDIYEVRQVKLGLNTEILEPKIQKAYGIHYFWGSWID